LKPGEIRYRACASLRPRYKQAASTEPVSTRDVDGTPVLALIKAAPCANS
jgi:hypothetical protein